MTITTHNDADGITAGYLFGLATDDHDIRISEFGQVADGSVAVLDMHPLSNPDYSGLVIDHHPGHPENSSYRLIYDHAPASVIVYKNYKDKIPENEHWKVVCGAVGDMEPYSVPADIWDRFPILCERITKLYGWKHEAFSLRVYQKLSSGLNALSKLERQNDALDVLESAESPVELILDRKCTEARKLLKDATKEALKDIDLIEFRGVYFGTIESDISIEGRLATQLSSELRDTVVIQNLETGGFSIRGDLTTWVESKLLSIDDPEVTIVVGGHPQAKGGTIEPYDQPLIELFQIHIK